MIMGACSDDQSIVKAARIVMDGGVIVFPTDTVYGIGCDPYNAEAVSRVYDIKSRDLSKPLPVLVDSIRTARSMAVMDGRVLRMAERFWPGPLTIILKVLDKRLAGSLYLKEQDGIALRIPDHRCALRLLDACKAIAGTSANLSGMGSTGDPSVCAEAMTGCDMILDGGVIQEPAESTIVDARDGRITVIREGKKLGLREIAGS